MNETKSTRSVVAMTLSFVLLLAPAAFGSSRTINDPRDVPPRRIEIKSVSHGHHNGKLKHTIVAHEKFTTARGPCVVMETNGNPGNDWEICGYGNMTDLHQQRTHGTATIRRPNRRSIVYIFRPRAIDSPGSYKWFVQEFGVDACRSCDRAPNSGYVRHDL